MRPIDADALIETISDHVTTVSCCPTVDWARGKTQFKDQCLEDIKNAPTVGGWISVKDRLPEEQINPKTNDFEYVLCAMTFGDVRAYKYGRMDGNTKAHFWKGLGIIDKYVTHWMPLPETPRQEEVKDV